MESSRSFLIHFFVFSLASSKARLQRSEDVGGDGSSVSDSADGLDNTEGRDAANGGHKGSCVG